MNHVHTPTMLGTHNFLIGLTNGVFLLFETLLGLRFVFKLLGANSRAPFVDWLYGTTDIVLSPFRNMFPNSVISNHFVLDITALAGLVLYALIAMLIVYLVDFLTGHRGEHEAVVKV